MSDSFDAEDYADMWVEREMSESKRDKAHCKFCGAEFCPTNIEDVRRHVTHLCVGTAAVESAPAPEALKMTFGISGMAIADVAPPAPESPTPENPCRLCGQWAHWKMDCEESPNHLKVLKELNEVRDQLRRWAEKANAFEQRVRCLEMRLEKP